MRSIAARLTALTGLVMAVFAWAPLALAADATPPAKPDLARGEAIAKQSCGACHSFDGQRGMAMNPIIAGQVPEYLVRQLQAFKSGQRNNPIMKGFAATLNEADMRHVAAFYGSKTAQNGTARDASLVQEGERIWRGGIPDRQIAACAGCHSPNGAGIPIQYPRLSAQHAEYTEVQLRAFRDGSRKNLQMNDVAAKMNDKEIKAVSDFVAGLR